MTRERGQVVLLAAAVVVVAVVPMALAYHQLGYDDDVTHRAETTPPETRATERLSGAVQTADDSIAGAYSWTTFRRADAARVVRSQLTGVTDALHRHGSREGVLYDVAENGTVASRWAAENCPTGPKRAFGPCVADGGVVLQERANETTLVGVALDVRVRSKHRESRLHLRIAAR